MYEPEIQDKGGDHKRGGLISDISNCWCPDFPWEGQMATHAGILAWKIPGTEDHCGYGPWGHKELSNGAYTGVHSPDFLSLSLFSSPKTMSFKICF